MPDTAPAPAPAPVAAPKKPAKKPATSVRKPAQAKKARTPLELLREGLRKQMEDLERQREEAGQLARSAELARGPLARRPQWWDFFAQQLGVSRPNPVPDGGSLKVAREQVVTEILDRIDLACRAGIIRVVTDPDTGREVVVIADGLMALMHQVSPKDYPLALREPDPTPSAPGSPERIEEYERRAGQVDPETGEPLVELHAAGDANDLTDAVLTERLNGMGKRVLGRAKADPPSGPAPAEG